MAEKFPLEIIVDLDIKGLSQGKPPKLVRIVPEENYWTEKDDMKSMFMTGAEEVRYGGLEFKKTFDVVLCDARRQICYTEKSAIGDPQKSIATRYNPDQS